MKHSGPSAKYCPLCKSHVAKLETQLERDLALSLLNKKHNVAVNRRIRDESLRSLGLTKVHAGGRTFWE